MNISLRNLVLLMAIVLASMFVSAADFSCQETTTFLDPRFPHFSDAGLENVRQMAVSMNILDTMRRACTQGKGAASAIQASLDQARQNDNAAHSAVTTASMTDDLGTTDEDFLQKLKSNALTTPNCEGVHNAALCAAISNKITAVALRAMAAEMRCFEDAQGDMCADGQQLAAPSKGDGASNGGKEMFQNEMAGVPSGGKSQMEQFMLEGGGSATSRGGSEFRPSEVQLRQELAAMRQANQARTMAEEQAARQRNIESQTHSAQETPDDSEDNSADVLNGILSIGNALIGSGALTHGSGSGSYSRGGSSNSSPSSQASTPGGRCSRENCGARNQ